jgi:peptide/nickel transport system permease protein
MESPCLVAGCGVGRGIGNRHPAGNHPLSAKGKGGLAPARATCPARGAAMTIYIVRRLLYTVPILIGINLLTFTLFFIVNTPNDMARLHLGIKRVTPEAIEKWKKEHGYDKSLLVNAQEQGTRIFTETIFFEKSISLFLFDFGHADDGRDIGRDIQQRMGPSLAIAIPGLIIGLLINIVAAMTLAFFRATYLDYWGVIIAVAMMSISLLFYIIGGQFLFSKLFRLVPISGFDEGISMVKFLILPTLIGLLSGVGSGSRWYRTLFLEEIGKDYVRTARAKGISESIVLFRHVLRNAAIPILTGVVVVIPLLFLGALLTESFFGIPGLGSYTIDAINSQDFGIVRAMVFLGSVLYIVGLILTDITYAWADPRVRLGG